MEKIVKETIGVGFYEATHEGEALKVSTGDTQYICLGDILPATCVPKEHGVPILGCGRPFKFKITVEAELLQ